MASYKVQCSRFADAHHNDVTMCSPGTRGEPRPLAYAKSRRYKSGSAHSGDVRYPPRNDQYSPSRARNSGITRLVPRVGYNYRPGSRQAAIVLGSTTSAGPKGQ
jgi:hypothetical protein